MADDYQEKIQRAAADQAWLETLSPAEREAEMQRRAELFKANQTTNQRGQANKNSFGSKVKFYLGVLAVLAVLVIGIRIFFGGTTSVERLDIGDCFMFPEEGAERFDTPDCTEVHEGQIFYQFSPRGMTDEERDTACLANIDRISTEATDALGPGSDIEVGSFAVVEEDTDVIRTINCWVGFEPMNSTSVVVTE